MKTSIKSFSDCSSFEIDKDESEILFGGFREYIPPIYEEKQERVSFNPIQNLFSDNIKNPDDEKAKKD
ncbi:MAG: hypothetical protein QM610_00665 [Chitinophagaceae bacterium]